MLAALFCTTRYRGPASHTTWPAACDTYTSEWAEKSIEQTVEQFRLGDEAGFDWVTVAEHHFAPFSMTPNPMVMAASLVNVVKRAKIAILGPDIPILNPVRVAEEIAMVDTISGGRVIVGLMRGSPNEYVTYNINPAESRERFEECYRIIKSAWTQKQPFGWQGRYYEYRSICTWPRPVQDPHPPIYMSTASPEAGEFAAKNRIGAGFAFTTLQIATKAAQFYREKCNEYGWTPEPEQIVYRLGMHCAEDDDEAIEDLRSAGGGQPAVGLSFRNRSVESAVAESGFYGRDLENQRGRLQSRGEVASRIEKGQVLVGTPDTILKQIKRIRDELGCGVLDLSLGAQLGDKTRKSIELFGEKVLPRMHEL
jgi:alkanesulfonate monooxygenase SsuD/methylene tetrahydromethanopterin reductase-like flavin-dependent oxidoreductase (luciferase family)